MSKVKFVAIEGIDYSGKTTLVKALKEYYESIGKKILTFRQPGSTAVGQQIRDVLLSTDMDEETRILLFIASRKHFYNTEIIPLLNDDLDQEVIIITDRWWHSAVAYNVFNKGHYLQEYYNKLVEADLEQCVDLAIYLHVDLQTSKQRRDSRLEISNHFDVAADEVIENRIKGYQSLVQEGEMIQVDGNRPMQHTLVDVVDYIDTIK